jgi:hypothetical protein
MIGTGGYLSRLESFDPGELLPGDALTEEILMLPKSLEYYRDSQYLIPLLGNLVGILPRESVLLGLSALCHEGTSLSRHRESRRGGGENWS